MTDIAVDAPASSSPVAAVGFKKRGAKKSNLRRPEVEATGIKLEPNGEAQATQLQQQQLKQEEQDELDSRALEEVRFEQEQRRRKQGLNTVMAKRGAGSVPTHADDAAGTDSNGQSLGTKKYTSRLDIGIMPDKATKHEALMEKYVQDQLSLSGNAAVGSAAIAAAALENENDAGKKAKTGAAAADAALYELASYIDVTDGSAATERAAASCKAAKTTEDQQDRAGADADVGVYAGIAEVELPPSYALKNIRETEAWQRRTANGGGGGGYVASSKRSVMGVMPTTVGYRQANGGYDGKSDRYAKPMGHTEWVERDQKRAQAADVRAAGGADRIPTVAAPAEAEAEAAAAAAGARAGGKRKFDDADRVKLPKPGTASDNRLLEAHKKKWRN